MDLQKTHGGSGLYQGLKTFISSETGCIDWSELFLVHMSYCRLCHALAHMQNHHSSFIPAVVVTIILLCDGILNILCHSVFYQKKKKWKEKSGFYLNVKWMLACAWGLFIHTFAILCIYQLSAYSRSVMFKDFAATAVLHAEA